MAKTETPEFAPCPVKVREMDEVSKAQIRREYAMRAMSVLLAASFKVQRQITKEEIAKDAFIVADAMLEAE